MQQNCSNALIYLCLMLCKMGHHLWFAARVQRKQKIEAISVLNNRCTNKPTRDWNRVVFFWKCHSQWSSEEDKASIRRSVALGMPNIWTGCVTSIILKMTMVDNVVQRSCLMETICVIFFTLYFKILLPAGLTKYTSSLSLPQPAKLTCNVIFKMSLLSQRFF